MKPMLSMIRSLVAVLIVCLVAQGVSAANYGRRRSNQARSRQSQLNALNSAIQQTKARMAAAQAVVNATGAVYMHRQTEAGQSQAKFQNAMSDMEHADAEKFGASQELSELMAKIEKFQPEDAPIKKAHKEYDAAVESLADIRADIYESDKYQSLHASALQSPNKGAELAKVQKICFDEDPEYKEAKEKVSHTREAYNKIRYELYEKDPEWAPAVKRAKDATVAANKAATSVKATGMEKGIEKINARDAAKRLALAQAELADAQMDLKQLESRRKQLQPSSKTTQQTQSNKNANNQKKK
jgi:hypothetical protein